MPEPTDPLRARLAATPGLDTLVAEARAAWLARAERGAAGSATDAAAPTAVDDPAVDAPSEGSAGLASDALAGPTAAPGARADSSGARIDGDAGADAAAIVGADVASDSARAWAEGAGAGAGRTGVSATTPRWRAFEDAFPTFYQFTNRPRR